MMWAGISANTPRSFTVADRPTSDQGKPARMRSLCSPRLAPAPLRRLSIAFLAALTTAPLVSGVALAQEESVARWGMGRRSRRG